MDKTESFWPISQCQVKSRAGGCSISTVGTEERASYLREGWRHASTGVDIQVGLAHDGGGSQQTKDSANLPTTYELLQSRQAGCSAHQGGSNHPLIQNKGLRLGWAKMETFILLILDRNLKSACLLNQGSHSHHSSTLKMWWIRTSGTLSSSSVLMEQDTRGCYFSLSENLAKVSNKYVPWELVLVLHVWVEGGCYYTVSCQTHLDLPS